jgi:hypothetical protein
VTLQEFAQVFAPLAVQLRFTDADEATIRVYFEAMKTLDVELVAAAAKRFAEQPGQNGEKVWFPGTPEWRAMVVRIEYERRQELQRRMLERQKAGMPPLCSACDDTSFEPVGDRYQPCACRKLRRLELLGVRPMPEPPLTLPEGDPTQIEKGLAMARAAVKGMA